MIIDDFKAAAPPAKSPLSARNDPPELTATEAAVPFRTPEQVAAEPASTGPSDPGPAAAGPTPPDENRPHRSMGRFRLHWPPDRKEWLVGLAVVVLLAAAGGTAWALTHHQAKVVPKPKAVVVQKPKVVVPTTVPSNLTGLPVDPSLNNVPVTGVMIENSIYARPQSGLSQAGVVFEAIAEGGITRFLALFQDTAPGNVGPIRSARPYYEQWALGFDAGYAHVGGSPEALADITSWNVRDLNQFYYGGYYHRISSRDAPHNVYTAISTLNQLEAKKGYTTSNYTGFPRKAEAPAKVPTARTVNLAISGPTYDVAYTYDPATNSYKRNMGGAPHIDANTNTQISPKVVIALVIPYSLEADGYHSSYNTIGSGPVYVFQDGIVTTGQWAKSSNTSQFVFTDANGAVIKLNPGQTWLTAVGHTSDVVYAP